MTYRFVPQKWLRWLQIATLFCTAIVGLGVVCLPRTAAQLSKIEETMSGDWFGWSLFIAGLIGGCGELWMWGRTTERWTALVAWAHIVCCGALAGFFVGSAYGVLMTNWRAFGTPTLVGLLFLWHLAFIQRRPRDKVTPARTDLYTGAGNGGTTRIERMLKEHDL